jgi:ParB-like chromosome segregation protein Spo0J
MSVAPVVPTKIETWAIDKHKPYTRNARTHTPAQIEQIQNSISKFGFTNPILANSDGTVIAGHCRLQAAIALNMAKVPVILLDHLSAAEQKAYLLADNKLALNADWDLELLKGELLGLEEDNFDMTLLGWTEAELEFLKLGMGEWESDMEDVDKIQENDSEAPGLVKVRCANDKTDEVKAAIRQLFADGTLEVTVD